MKIPKYRFIYQDLLKLIESKNSEYGKMIPTEKKLCEKYNVSRITIRHALYLLKNDLRIETIQGKGSIVAANPIKIKIEYESIARKIIAQGHYPNYDILKFENIINNDLSNKFNINESLVQLRRVRSKIYLF